MEAWLLMYFLGFPYGVVIPNIETKAECERLALEMYSGRKDDHVICKPYRVANPHGPHNGS